MVIQARCMIRQVPIGSLPLRSFWLEGEGSEGGVCCSLCWNNLYDLCIQMISFLCMNFSFGRCLIYDAPCDVKMTYL
jgi:hypothetical protein